MLGLLRASSLAVVHPGRENPLAMHLRRQANDDHPTQPTDEPECAESPLSVDAMRCDAMLFSLCLPCFLSPPNGVFLMSRSSSLSFSTNLDVESRVEDPILLHSLRRCCCWLARWRCVSGSAIAHALSFTL